jgi:hypothetical protein
VTLVRKSIGFLAVACGPLGLSFVGTHAEGSVRRRPLGAEQSGVLNGSTSVLRG